MSDALEAVGGSAPKLTLAEVARRAGVGLGTASRALSNAPGVAPLTRQRVQDVAQQLHYVVSPAASSLARGSTSRVALVVPHLSRWFFGAVIEGLESVLKDADLDVLLFPVTSAAERQRFFERLPAHRKVDALVVIGFQLDELEQRRLDVMQVQIVAAGGQNASYPYATIDDYATARQAVDHLLFLGHRRIGMLDGIDPDQPSLVSGRSRAYTDALTESGVEIDEQLIVRSDWGGEHGARSMARLLGIARPPTAVFAHSDEIALGAIRTIRRAGLRVPQDISVIGIDDHPLAELTDLTTVRQDPFAQGVATAELLVDRLRGGTGEHSVILPTQLVIRATTGPPRPAADEL